MNLDILKGIDLRGDLHSAQATHDCAFMVFLLCLRSRKCSDLLHNHIANTNLVA